jgi:hypothetical protein
LDAQLLLLVRCCLAVVGQQRGEGVEQAVPGRRVLGQLS